MVNTDNHDLKEKQKLVEKYRIFISYSRKDEDFVKTLVDVLEDLGHYLEFDTNIEPRTPFSAAIRSMIARSHIFMPIISPATDKSQWVHQETGYAIALQIPVLPIGLGIEPQGMIQSLHIINVDEGKRNSDDLADYLKNCLCGGLLRRIARPTPAIPKHQFEVTSWQEERTERLARYTSQVLHLGGSEPIRQMEALSSFSLPAENLTEEQWRSRESSNFSSHYYRNLKRLERLAFEDYVLRYGCKLIITPSISLERRGEEVTTERLKTLLDFLYQSKKQKSQVEVIEAERIPAVNKTIVGSWFLATARVSKKEGYPQTIFNWHGPTVLRAIEDFDRQFEEIRKVNIKGPKSGNVDDMIDYLKNLIEKQAKKRTGKIANEYKET